jgi:hypothetical protein
MKQKPLYLNVCLSICRAFANTVSSLHYLLVRMKIIAPPVWFDKFINEGSKQFTAIWQTRIVRRFISVAVRSFIRSDILTLVESNIPFHKNNGSVIAFCHTPWKRLLLQWSIEQKNILVIAGSSLHTKNCRIEVKPTGYSALRKLVDHLQNKGHVAITIDSFNALKNCPVNFLGNYCNASLLPVRLSKLGNASLITVVPVFKDGKIRFIKGPDLETYHNDRNFTAVMQKLVSYLGNEIKKEPCIWSEFVK